jgi:F0F1-type ATP synthase assembly protein I
MKQADNETWSALASAGDSVLGIFVLVWIGAWLGFKLDDIFHSQPLCAVILAIIGVGLGIARMIWKALKAEKAEAKTSDPVTKTNADEDKR